MAAIRIGVIGDRDETRIAHRAIPAAIRLAGEQLGIEVTHEWLATDAIPDAAALAGFNAFWCAPGSPYRDMDGALRAIRHAREQRVPFLGTCGGFQHAVIEFARHVLGIADAEHAESTPDAANPVISALSCALVEVSDQVTLVAGSRIAAAYGTETATEGYHCSYGLNTAVAAQLLAGPLRGTAQDSHGEIRAVELDEHPFFVCTLFQPERAALTGKAPPLALALLRAAAR